LIGSQPERSRSPSIRGTGVADHDQRSWAAGLPMVPRAAPFYQPAIIVRRQGGPGGRNHYQERQIWNLLFVLGACWCPPHTEWLVVRQTWSGETRLRRTAGSDKANDAPPCRVACRDASGLVLVMGGISCMAVRGPGDYFGVSRPSLGTISGHLGVEKSASRCWAFGETARVRSLMRLGTGTIPLAQILKTVGSFYPCLVSRLVSAQQQWQSLKVAWPGCAGNEMLGPCFRIYLEGCLCEAPWDGP
jgi:hypothetical protein